MGRGERAGLVGVVPVAPEVEDVVPAAALTSSYVIKS